MEMEGGGGGNFSSESGSSPIQKVIILFKSIESFNIKKNHIGLAVSKILFHTQIHIMILFILGFF